MARLSRYLLRIFWSEAMALFAVAAFLLFLIQCLRLFDLVSGQGQGIFTLIGQALLGMPGLGILFLYVCLGIGLGRALRNLQASSELQIVHSSGLVGTLLRAIGLYAIGGALLVLLLTHVIDPLGSRATTIWASNIAADLVSRSMIPHKFARLGGGVTMVIGARDFEGNIADFFADDARNPASHRTYFAKSAVITRDDQGYVLRMNDGAVQYSGVDKSFSEISFTRYDLPLDSLTGAPGSSTDIEQVPSYELVGKALATGEWPEDVVHLLERRSSEGLRVLAISVFVAALALFPTGRRRRLEVPVEVAVLVAAFIERGLSTYVAGPFGLASGPVLLFAIFSAVLALRLRRRGRLRLRRVAA